MRYFKLKNTVLVFIGILGLILFLPQSADLRQVREGSDIEIHFRDSSFEDAIRDIIGKPNGSITRLDIKEITELNLSNMGISNLKGIEYFINLKKLDISDNNITDITPLEVVIRRGLEELVIMGNPLTIADMEKLDIWSGSSRDRDLHRQLLEWGFRLVTIEGVEALYTNDNYELKERDGNIIQVWANGRIVLNDIQGNLKIDGLKLEADNLILLRSEEEIVIVTPDGLETRQSLEERITDGDISEIFFKPEHDIAILNDKTDSEIEFINRQMREFVLEKMNAYGILAISEPTVYTSESGRRRTVRFDVITDNGETTIYLKPVTSEIEGIMTERASELGLTPASRYIAIEGRGYCIVEHFEGIKLRELLWEKPQMLFDNYHWLFEELGHKIGILDKNGLLYTDFIHFNTFVNLETREIAILDYEIARAGPPVEQIRQLIEYLNEHIAITPEMQQEMLDIFNHAYAEVFNN